jgi:hypothetical protein
MLTGQKTQPWGGPDLPEWDFHGHHQLGHSEIWFELPGSGIHENTASGRARKAAVGSNLR